MDFLCAVEEKITPRFSRMKQELTRKDDKRLITKKMAADRLSVSTRTIDRMVAEGALEKIFVRGSVRFRERDIEAIVEGEV